METFTEAEVVQACRIGNIPKLQDIFNTEQGRSLINSQDRVFGWTPLFRAIMTNKLEMTLFLLHNGADPNIPNNEGDTILHYLCSNEKKKFIEMTLEYNPDVNKLNSQGDSPLHLACFRENHSICKLLVNQGADPNLQNSITGDTPVHLAFELGNVVIAQYLISNGGNMGITNNEGQIPPDLSTPTDRKRILEKIGPQEVSSCSSIAVPSAKEKIDRLTYEAPTVEFTEELIQDPKESKNEVLLNNPLMEIESNENTVSIYFDDLEEDKDENEESLTSDRVRAFFSEHKPCDEDMKVQTTSLIDLCLSRSSSGTLSRADSPGNRIDEIKQSDLKEYSSGSKIEFKAYDSRGTCIIDRQKTETLYQEEGMEETITIRPSKSEIHDEFYVCSDKYESNPEDLNRLSYTFAEEPRGPSSPVGKVSPDDLSSDSEEAAACKSGIFKSPQRKRKNIIVEPCEKNKFLILSTEQNFISIDMGSEKKTCNIQSFDRRCDETEVTSLKTHANDSKLSSPVAFSSDYLKDKADSKTKSCDPDNPFKVANDRCTSADLIHQAIQPLNFSEISQKQLVNRRIGKSHSADLVMCMRDDSLNSINIFEDIRHKSSTDLPIFLHYNNLEVNENEEEWKKCSNAENIFNPTPEYNWKGMSDDATPSFSLKNVVSKFSAIKTGFDTENVSSDNEECKNQRMLDTILEQDTEEEKTERQQSSELSEACYSAKLDERHSNVYATNMQSLKSRDRQMKNPFIQQEISSMLVEITEEDDVPEEQEISRYHSMNAPRLIDNQRSIDAGAIRGSECYCCYSIRT